MACTTWSNGTRLATPESASCADEKAAATPMAFLAWQGTSTSPPTGSHTSPSRFDMASDAAVRACSGEPPMSWAHAAAAMAAALPTSAWQPPSAPATHAPVWMFSPMAAAQKSASSTSASGAPRWSARASTQPGTTPAEPAVGAATITPMAADRSSTAIARATASVCTGPMSEGARRPEASAIPFASPPMKPPSERCGRSMGAVVSRRMASTTRRISASARSAPMSICSRARMTPPMESPSSEQASRSCSPSSKSSSALTPGPTTAPAPESEMNVA